MSRQHSELHKQIDGDDQLYHCIFHVCANHSTETTMSFSAASLPPSTDLTSIFNALLSQRGAAPASGKVVLDVDTLDGFVKEAYRIVSLLASLWVEKKTHIHKISAALLNFLIHLPSLTELAHHQPAP